MKDKNRGVSPYLNSSANSVITQPVIQPKNILRTQQIKTLHLQFQDLKKRIKDVQSKNVKIIEQINKGYDFKKKKQQRQYNHQANPIVYYEQPQQQSQLVIERKSHKKDNSDGDYKGHIKKNSNIKKNSQNTNLKNSIQYPNTQYPLQERQHLDLINSKSNIFYRVPLPVASPNIYSPPRGSQYFIQPQEQQVHINQFNGLNPYQLSIQLPNNAHMSQNRLSFEQNSYQYEEALKLEREKVTILQSQLQSRSEDKIALKKLQKKYNSIAANYNQAVQLCLEDFFQQVLKKKLAEIDKCVKKNENKVKKIQLKLKDRQQDRKSRRLMEQHRERRSQSRSKKSNSPLEDVIVYRTKRESSKKLTNELSIPQEIRSKKSDSWPNHQFEQIAMQYQEIIQIKTKQNEQCEAKLRQRQSQLAELASKCAKLQVKITDLIDIPKVAKQRKNSQREENLLANLIFDNEGDTQNLNKKIGELQAAIEAKKKELIVKDSEIHQHQNKLSEYVSRIRKNQTQISRLRQQLKKTQKEKKQDGSILSKVKILQQEIQSKNSQYFLLKDRYCKLQTQKIKKQCQNLTFINKIKKLQAQLQMSEQKINQLQKIIQSSTGSQGGDLLQKSIYVQKIDQNDVHALQDQKQKLEEELLKQRERIFLLQKNNQKLTNTLRQMEDTNRHLQEQNQDLQYQNQNMRVSLKVQEFQKYNQEIPANPLKKLLEQGDCLSQNEEDHLIASQLQDFKRKYEQTQHLLKIQNQKTFEQNRKVLKLTSQLNYFKEQLSQRQTRYQKLRKQHEETKCQISLLHQEIQAKDNQLQVQKKVNAQKIRQIESQWQEFQQQIKNNYEEHLDGSHNSHDHDLLRTSRLTETSFVNNYKNTYNNVNAQNEKLLEKLKQAEKIIQLQKEMDERILTEYRNNVQKIKSELREKVKQNDAFNQENEMLKRKIKYFQQNELTHQNSIKNKQYQGYQSSSHKLIELQNELNEIRELNIKRQGVQQQLYNQINEKEKQIEGQAVRINMQQQKIEQLQDLLELKEINLNSHVSIQQKPRMRQSLQSHNSLKYSMLSSHTNRDKTIELDLSEVTQSFIDHSIIENVSEVFAREEFPYEKMNLKRIQQRRLFQKTAAYIKSLKNAIEQKNKKIKGLEKKIKELRNSELVRKDIYEIKTNTNQDLDNDSQEIDNFKDSLSVQLQSTNNKRYKLKQLEHETKLTIQQNNLLTIRIESLEQELIKAEEQEDDLMKMKDLYKEEIKNMVKKNQEQIKILQEQVKKQKQKNQQAESIQKMQALRQIFFKIITSFVSLQTQSSSKSSRKRQQKKKQLSDFVKVAINLFNYESSVSDRLLNSLQQIKR